MWYMVPQNATKELCNIMSWHVFYMIVDTMTIGLSQPNMDKHTKLTWCMYIRYICLTQWLILIGHLYLSGVWLGVNLRTNTQNTYVEKRLDYMLKKH